MSIAVSATVLPSRILAGMLVFIAALANGAICYSALSVDGSKIIIFVFIFINSLLSLYMLFRYFKRRQAIRLDISDAGEIILRILALNPSNVDSVNVKLTEKSTLWPHLLLLSLSSDDGQIYILAILHDSVEANTFRKLSIAFNWIAMHASSRAASDTDISSGNF